MFREYQDVSSSFAQVSCRVRSSLLVLLFFLHKLVFPGHRSISFFPHLFLADNDNDPTRRHVKYLKYLPFISEIKVNLSPNYLRNIYEMRANFKTKQNSDDAKWRCWMGQETGRRVKNWKGTVQYRGIK